MRLIDADIFKENILSGLYVFCQENKEDIARAIDSELTVEPDFKLFKEWKCPDCIEREKSFHDGWQMAKKRFERPQGEWIYNQYDGNARIGNWHCSICHNICYEMKLAHDNYNFCPNCGAVMRGDNNEIG